MMDIPIEAAIFAIGNDPLGECQVTLDLYQAILDGGYDPTPDRPTFFRDAASLIQRGMLAFPSSRKHRAVLLNHMGRSSQADGPSTATRNMLLRLGRCENGASAVELGLIVGAIGAGLSSVYEMVTTPALLCLVASCVALRPRAI